MQTAIDLRSDTVTRPTSAMRAAMAAAEVGDDVYGEDPTVARLEQRAAELLGKEHALFVPSGTMANQLALLLCCERGDDVIIGEGNHCRLFESGAGSAWAQVSFTQVGKGGTFTAAQLLEAIHPPEYHYPTTRLVAIENTHNRGGGALFPQSDVLAIVEVARARGLLMHMDGARIWNASIASGLSEAQLAAPFDTVSACFSKGLGAPVGSILAMPAAFATRARKLRKMLGGGMRQAGVLAAAALHALDHHRARLAEDHDNARLLAAGLEGHPRLSCPREGVQTNIVMIDLHEVDAREVVASAARHGVKLNAVSKHRLRAVTHLDVSRADITRAVDALRKAVDDVVPPA